jgi:hypothetical protein
MYIGLDEHDVESGFPTMAQLVFIRRNLDLNLLTGNEYSSSLCLYIIGFTLKVRSGYTYLRRYKAHG